MAAKETLNLEVSSRSIHKKKVSQLRRQGILPGVICGKDIDSTPVQVNLKDFEKVYKKVHGTSIINLNLDGKTMPALIHDIQRDNISRDLLHVDFQKISLTDQVTVEVPLSFVGTAPAEKEGFGKVGHETLKLHIKCLPNDIPSSIEVDVSVIKEKHDVIHAKDLALPKGVNLAHGVSEDKVIAKIVVTKITQVIEEKVEGEEGAVAEEAKPAEE